jgi:hypothetical protein
MKRTYRIRLIQRSLGETPIRARWVRNYPLAVETCYHEIPGWHDWGGSTQPLQRKTRKRIHQPRCAGDNQ